MVREAFLFQADFGNSSRFLHSPPSTQSLKGCRRVRGRHLLGWVQEPPAMGVLEGRFFRPSGAYRRCCLAPTACAVGCILSPLCGLSAARLFFSRSLVMKAGGWPGSLGPRLDHSPQLKAIGFRAGDLHPELQIGLSSGPGSRNAKLIRLASSLRAIFCRKSVFGARPLSWRWT